MTIWDAKEKKAHFLDAREYAPAAAHETIFTADNEVEAFRGSGFGFFFLRNNGYEINSFTKKIQFKKV